MAAERLADYLSTWAAADPRRMAVAETVRIITDTCREISVLVADGSLGQDLGAAVTENIQGETQEGARRPRQPHVDRRLPRRAGGGRGVGRGRTAGPGQSESRSAGRLRSSRRLLEYRHQRFDRNDLLDPTRQARRRPRGPVESFLQKGRNQLGGRLRALRAADHARSCRSARERCASRWIDAANAFILSHPPLSIPAQTREFAINMANWRHWPQPVQAYVDECLDGTEGPRGENTNMRWVASLGGGLQPHPDPRWRVPLSGRRTPRLWRGPGPGALRGGPDCLRGGTGGRVTPSRARVPSSISSPRPCTSGASLMFGSHQEVARIESHYARG